MVRMESPLRFRRANTFEWLKHQNIELHVPKRQGAFARLRKLHHKLMVIDERIVVAGSFNYTQPANEYNDENIFVMGSTHKEVEGIEVEAHASGQLAVYLMQDHSLGGSRSTSLHAYGMARRADEPTSSRPGGHEA